MLVPILYAFKNFAKIQRLDDFLTLDKNRSVLLDRHYLVLALLSTSVVMHIT